MAAVSTGRMARKKECEKCISDKERWVFEKSGSGLKALGAMGDVLETFIAARGSSATHRAIELESGIYLFYPNLYSWRV